MGTVSVTVSCVHDWAHLASEPMYGTDLETVYVLSSEDDIPTEITTDSGFVEGALVRPTSAILLRVATINIRQRQIIGYSEVFYCRRCLEHVVYTSYGRARVTWQKRSEL